MATTKRKVKVPKGYDSKFEYDLHQVMPYCRHHPVKIPYTQHKEYEPDFVYDGHYTKYLIEAKGRFRDSAEARKYLDVRNSLHESMELVFVFQKASTPMPFAKKRKDGTKFTHAEWANKHGFTWYEPHELPREWSK